MPPITGLIHACNHERQLGRALVSLRLCDEVLVVDHGSTDGTLRIAREHGARIIPAIQAHESGAGNAGNEWVLCLLPSEAIAEDLEASLLEWKTSDAVADQIGYKVAIRKQIESEWQILNPELRLVNRKQVRWRNNLPDSAADAPIMPGYILRIPNRED